MGQFTKDGQPHLCTVDAYWRHFLEHTGIPAVQASDEFGRMLRENVRLAFFSGALSIIMMYERDHGERGVPELQRSMRVLRDASLELKQFMQDQQEANKARRPPPEVQNDRPN